MNQVIDQQGNIVAAGNASPLTVTGLTNGVSYTFTVKAVNSVGKSDPSAPSNEITPKASSTPGDGDNDSGDGGSGTPSTGGGGGGAPAAPANERSISAGQRATFTLNGVAFTIPSGAINRTTKVKVVQVPNTTNLSIPSGMTLVGEMFDITKDTSGNFAQPITLSLPFDTSTLDRDTHELAIYWLNEETGEWVILDNIKVDWTNGTVSGEIDHFTKFAVLLTKKESDVASEEVVEGSIPTVVSLIDIAGHWGEPFIIDALEKKLVSGYPDGTFKPNNSITRAEFTVMLVNALQLDGTGAAHSFTDRDKIGSWAQQAIALAVEARIINGYADGSFRPDALITRAEMASMIARALGLSLDVQARTVFADDEEIPHWAKGAVQAVQQLGIVSGRGDNQFVPNDTATRTKSVVMLLRMLEHK